MTGRHRHRLHVARRLIAGATVAWALFLSGTAGLQDANANGDTRTLQLYHEHTRESATITFRRDGRYVPEGLRQLNWFLRDWRVDEQISMDPKLFDIVWQVYREARATGPIHVNSAYRSPQTNAALRRRSRAVAQFSQHMRGKALDFFLEDVPMARVREIGVKLQQGGVGFYPHTRSQFVHLDAGGVRSWPRLPDAHLARLFPDGRTVHIPRSGQPLAGYQIAKASILARGGTVAGFSTYAEGAPRKSFWASLFGGGDADEDEDLAVRSQESGTQVAAAETNQSGGGRGFFSFFGGGSPEPAPPAPEPVPVQAPPPATRGPGAAAGPVSTPVLSTPIHIPLPPRPPVILAALRSDAAAKTGSVTPVTARREPTRGPGRSSLAAIGADDKTALRSLFSSAATPTDTKRKSAGKTRDPILTTGSLATPASKARTSFSSTKLKPPKAGSFSGPAVARLPARR